MPVYRHRSELDHPVEEAFGWHARPGALERLTPPWHDVRVVEREGGLDGGTVRVRLQKGPAGVDWRIRHAGFRENRLFRDEQESGPFARWVHEHRFEPLGERRCAVEDVVDWELPGGGLTDLFAGPFGESELRRLFTFRHRRLREDLGRHAAYGNRLGGPTPGREVGREGSPERGPGGAAGTAAAGGAREEAVGGALARRASTDRPLRIAISGASGLIGSAMRHFLTTGGHEVVSLVRDRAAAEGREERVYWSAKEDEVDAAGLEGLDALVHLAGEPVFALRWTEEKKRRIRESRVEGTALLAGALARLERKPAVLVSGSGVHYYGRRGDEPVTEEEPPGEGFLAGVCRDWEAATAPAEEAGIRVCHLRSGLFLTPRGGALEKMLPAFRTGFGGELGSGKQYMSWIDPDDHIGLIRHAIATGEISGGLNATAPHPVTNRELTDTLGRVVHRPTVADLPATAIKLLAGEMGKEMLLGGARVVPEKASRTGFEFLRPRLEESLRFHLGRVD